MSILGPDQLYAVQTKSLQTIQNEQHDAEANLGETTSLLKGHVVRWYHGGRKYSQRELNADSAVLQAGAVLSVPAAIMLVWHSAWASRQVSLVWGVVVYCCGFLFMFNASRLFHSHARSEDPRTAFYLFLDKMGINCMIAGSYTPICIASGCHALLSIEWALAFFGFVWELALWKRTVGWKSIVDIARFVTAGWIGLVFLPVILPCLPLWAALVILAHGVLFTIGTIFLRCHQLEFHIMIWHSLVLAAAGLYYLVVWSHLSVGPIIPLPAHEKMVIHRNPGHH